MAEKEYIEREAVLEMLKRECSPKVFAYLADQVNAIPAADVRPVKWIPVTERLPENLTSVIVHRKDGGIFTWEYFNTSPTDECWIDDSMNVYSFYDVTHWMPLPEPPKEE